MNVRLDMRHTKSRTVEGGGVLNKLINKLPFEAHIPGYNYCGPGTNLDLRLARGDPGINKLDSACKEHDIAYRNYQDLERRHIADRILAEKAKRRIYARDASFGERLASLGVSSLISLKEKVGMGVKRKRKGGGGRKLPIRKQGGFILPLITGLGAAVTAGATALKTIKDISNAKKAIKETERHNRAMEAITEASKASGKGLYLHPYKKSGEGLYLRPYKKSGDGLKNNRKKGKGKKKSKNKNNFL